MSLAAVVGEGRWAVCIQSNPHTSALSFVLIRGDGRRAPATAVDFSTSYAMRASASAGQKRPRWHHHWHHGTRGLGSRSGQPQEHSHGPVQPENLVVIESTKTRPESQACYAESDSSQL